MIYPGRSLSCAGVVLITGAVQSNFVRQIAT